MLEQFKGSYAGAVGGSVRSSSSYGGSRANSDETEYPNKASARQRVSPFDLKQIGVGGDLSDVRVRRSCAVADTP